jgi:tetratricopeptide (TPR) repeat protein
MVEVLGAKRRAVEADRKDGDAWGNLGMVFDAHEKMAEADVCYRAAMTLDPEDARWPYLLAQLVKETDPEEAVRLLHVCLAVRAPSPAHRATAELTLADLLLDLGRGVEANEIYRKVHADDPSNPWATYRVGAAAADSGDEGTAVPLLMSLARNPFGQKKSSAALAALHRRAGRTKEAGGFEYASSLLPDDLHWPNPFVEEMAKYKRGQHVLIDTVTRNELSGNHPAAVATAQRLVDLYPSPRTQLLLGRALLHFKDFEKASLVLEDTLHGDPNLVMAHAFLGMSRFELAELAHAAGHRKAAEDQYTKAISALDKAIEMKPDYAPGYYYRAQALMRLNRPDEALRAIRACIDRRPEEWQGYVVLGEVLSATGKRDEAIAALDQAIKLSNPNELRPRKAREKLVAGK